MLFWGWQIGHLIPAIASAAVLEAAAWLPHRLDLKDGDFKRIADICTLLLLILAIVVWSTVRAFTAVFLVFQWLPMVFLPIMLAYRYSTVDRIDISAFLVTTRRRSIISEGTGIRIDPTWPFLLLVVICAGAGNQRTPGFFAGIWLLSTWALWFRRSERYGPAVFLVLIAVAGTVGYAGQHGLHRLQRVIENKGMDWLSDESNADPYKHHTAIGSVGELKLSDRILFRVVLGPNAHPPLLLAETAYNSYRGGNWYALGVSPPAILSPGSRPGSWPIESSGTGNAASRLEVWQAMPRGEGLLKLPAGAVGVFRLPAKALDRHPLGAIRARGSPVRVRYQVRYRQNDGRQAAPPGGNDRAVPAYLKPVLARISAQLSLPELSPEDRPAAVVSYFHRRYRYSLAGMTPDNRQAAMRRFLEETHSGHCEYFATAATLLLRTTGVPARYVGGFLVDEFSPLEKVHVVRARHAHAWSQAFVDGRWRDLDPTPPDWTAMEAGKASWMMPARDWFAYMWFRFNAWRDRDATSSQWLTGLAILPLLGMILWRLRRGKRRPMVRRRLKRSLPPSQGRPAPALLAPVESYMRSRGFPRHRSEPPAAWVQRLTAEFPDPAAIDALAPIVAEYYRWRFDPSCASEKIQQGVADRMADWLTAMTSGTSSSGEETASAGDNRRD